MFVTPEPGHGPQSLSGGTEEEFCRLFEQTEKLAREPNYLHLLQTAPVCVGEKEMFSSISKPNSVVEKGLTLCCCCFLLCGVCYCMSCFSLCPTVHCVYTYV